MQSIWLLGTGEQGHRVPIPYRGWGTGEVTLHSCNQVGHQGIKNGGYVEGSVGNAPISIPPTHESLCTNGWSKLSICLGKPHALHLLIATPATRPTTTSLVPPPTFEKRLNSAMPPPFLVASVLLIVSAASPVAALYYTPSSSSSTPPTLDSRIKV